MSAKTAKYKKNSKIGKYYQVETGLVINSTEEKLVIGRIKGDEFIPLDQDDDIEQTLKLCEDSGLKFDQTLVSFEEEEEEDAQSVKSAVSEKVQVTTQPTVQPQPTPVVQPADRSDVLTELVQLLHTQNEQMKEFVGRMIQKSSANSATDAELIATKQTLAETRKELDALKAKLKSLF